MSQNTKRSYSFKEGLAMMAAKDVGIDPYLAADAGEDARSILAALRRAKTAKGAEKAKHISAAQTELRKLSPQQHGKLINALQAKVLALQGRGRDTAVAHLEPGEMVVPRAVLTPQLVKLIAAEAAKLGIDPKQLIVGGRKASINPATGAEEFGWFGDLIDSGVNKVKGWFGGDEERQPEQPSFTMAKSLGDDVGPKHANPLMNRQRNPLSGTAVQADFPGQATYDQANKFRLEAHVDKDNWQDRKPWLDEMNAYAHLPDGSDAKKQAAADIIDHTWKSERPYDPFLVNVRKQISVNSESPSQYTWLTNRDTHEKLFQAADEASQKTPWQNIGEAIAGTALTTVAPEFGVPLAMHGAAALAGDTLAVNRRKELRNLYEEQYGNMPRVGRY
jgi:hypothetical protein